MFRNDVNISRRKNRNKKSYSYFLRQSRENMSKRIPGDLQMTLGGARIKITGTVAWRMDRRGSAVRV